MIKISNKILILFLSIFAALCAVGIYFVTNTADDAQIAYIYKDNKLIKTVDLKSVDAPYVIDLKTNKICVEKGGIYMKEANCPDKLCVKQGRITKNGRSIVCLPNRIVIEIKQKDGGVDAVSGGR